ncbi:hypothetical protein [Parasediminibacterium sp. JCM 36343]|uniref:hypothetical protein n=1 Tax=Parasediminibacterium sp. JCM 36343 TaxID=3374279 RepID=UPI003978E065
MDLNEILPADFHPTSKVWVYQSSRLFSMSEAFELEDLFAQFVQDWKSHGTPVKGYANLFYGQFIVLMADETATGVSGCSTDSSVHLIKKIEQHFKVDMFNRQNLAFYIKEKVQLLPLAHLSHALENGFITPETLYFNNLVATKEALINEWLVPAGQTWLGKRMEQKVVSGKS